MLHKNLAKGGSAMKRIRAVLCLVLALAMIIPSEMPAFAATTMSDDVFVDNDNGTVQVTFTVDKDTTILILVDVPSENIDNTKNAHEAARYYYKLTEGKNVVNIPLTKGPGDYVIRVCKVLTTGKAAVLKSKTVTLSEAKAQEVFDVANMIVDYQTSEQFIKKAKSLTKKCKTDKAKVKKIYNYIVQNFAYDYELLDVKVATSYYTPDNAMTFDRKLGICYDISSLFAAMLRSVDVEARVVTGYTPNVKAYHAWTEVWDADKEEWYSIDCTYDMCLFNMGSSKKTSMIKKSKDYSDTMYLY